MNYTVIMDNAPGPDTSDTSLTLLMKPDPVFTEIQQSDRIYNEGSGLTISILVRKMTSFSLHVSIMLNLLHNHSFIIILLLLQQL